jgi:hypothetical protein
MSIKIRCIPDYETAMVAEFCPDFTAEIIAGGL